MTVVMGYNLDMDFILGIVWIWAWDMGHILDMGRRREGVLSRHGMNICITDLTWGIQVQSGHRLER